MFVPYPSWPFRTTLRRLGVWPGRAGYAAPRARVERTAALWVEAPDRDRYALHRWV